MRTVCEKNKCNGCMACIAVCPKCCISIQDSIEALNAVIDESTCINCKLCEKKCPNIFNVEKKNPISWKQGWATPEIRTGSSSGGAALSIITNFIILGGYVAACLFKNGKFCFEITNDIEIAKSFAGSKYVKSNPEGIYHKIEEKLKSNKVLFVGLPCQVAGVKNCIKNHDNLYTIDLICHGTPSVKLLDKYLWECGYELSKLKDIKFRIKNDMGLVVNNKKINMTRVTDEYLCAFLQSIDYTLNCYSCQFASVERVADLTLGDSWGSELKNEEKSGISLMLIQNDKGTELLSISNIELRDVDIKNAIANNHQLSHPSILTKKRKRFLNLINKGCSFKQATFKVLPKMVVKQQIKRILIKYHLIKPMMN